MSTITKGQTQTLIDLQTGPLERPCGFASGVGGWMVRMGRLQSLGFVEISAPDDDGRVWASITEAGAAFKPPAARPVGRPKARAVRAGDLPNGLDAVNRMLARNGRGAK